MGRKNPWTAQLVKMKEFDLESKDPMDRSEEVTGLLHRWQAGDASALEQLTPLIYSELRRIAHGALKKEARSVPIETTGLVHEAFVRLLRTDVDWQDRKHFFALTARLIRRVLVDLARERKSDKRGYGIPHLALEHAHLVSIDRQPGILELDEALHSLGSFDERKARVIELRFFAGLTIDETADILEVSHATVERDFQAAKAWLACQMGRQDQD